MQPEQFAKIYLTRFRNASDRKSRDIRSEVIGKNDLGDFWFFSVFFIVILGFYEVYIIPKWLIKVPGHIAILFG